MSVIVRGMTMPVTCCTCPLIVYIEDIKWDVAGKEYIGAYCCRLTGELINNRKREDHCPLEPLPDAGNPSSVSCADSFPQGKLGKKGGERSEKNA